MIFVVDDNPDLAKFLARLLRRAGHEVEVFLCGEDLVQAVTHERPSLIILDMMMPDMNGIDCLQFLRARPETASLPVIMYSADDLGSTKDEAMRAGATDYVVKSRIEWKDFLSLVRRRLALDT